jgi:hypothetical protein
MPLACSFCGLHATAFVACMQFLRLACNGRLVHATLDKGRRGYGVVYICRVP